MVLTLNVTDK